MADLRIDDAQIQQMVERALFEHLTPERRDELCKIAIKQLCTSGDRGLVRTPSELQSIFNRAVQTVAYEVCREEFDKEENRAKIRGLFVEALDSVVEKGDARDKLVEQIAGKLADAMFGSRY